LFLALCTIADTSSPSVVQWTKICPVGAFTLSNSGHAATSADFVLRARPIALNPGTHFFCAAGTYLGPRGTLRATTISCHEPHYAATPASTPVLRRCHLERTLDATSDGNRKFRRADDTARLRARAIGTRCAGCARSSQRLSRLLSIARPVTRTDGQR